MYNSEPPDKGILKYFYFLRPVIPDAIRIFLTEKLVSLLHNLSDKEEALQLLAQFVELIKIFFIA